MLQEQVKKANHLHTDQILSGEQLIVPIEENSQYIALKKIEQHDEKTEVASDMK